jgi:hypothetical protein
MFIGFSFRENLGEFRIRGSLRLFFCLQSHFHMCSSNISCGTTMSCGSVVLTSSMLSLTAGILKSSKSRLRCDPYRFLVGLYLRNISNANLGDYFSKEVNKRGSKPIFSSLQNTPTNKNK